MRIRRNSYVCEIFALLLLISVTHVAQAETVYGPVEWEESDGGNGHFYLYIDYGRAISWTNARDDAATRTHANTTGHMVTVTSAEEDAFLQHLMNPLIADAAGRGQRYLRVWIGLSDSEAEGEFKWVTNEQFAYSNWQRGEPNDAGGSEDFVHYLSSRSSQDTHSWTWNDSPDNPGDVRGVIVEFEMTSNSNSNLCGGTQERGALSNAGLPAEDRRPVPTTEEQEATAELIREAYSRIYDAARTGAEKIQLAEDLLTEAQATNDDPTGRYVLFRLACNMAVQGGDLAVAYQAIGQLNQEYDIDALAMKAETATSLLGEVRSSDDYAASAEAVADTINEAVTASQFDLASELAQASVDAARRTRARDALTAAVAKMREIEEFTAQFADVEEAFAQLETDPTNAEANLAVGKYQCFVLADWEQGLPMLALGSDPQLQSLAETELGEISDAASMKALGDAWWNYGEELTGSEKVAVQRRAACWYRRALPRLTGLSQSLAERRLREVLEP